MKHHDSMGRVCLLRCEHTGCNFKRTSCNQADEKRVFSLPSPTAPQKQDQPGTPDQSENHTNQCSFCSHVYAKQKNFSPISDVLPSPPPSLPPHVPSGCKKMPAQDPREGPLKVRPKCGPPPGFRPQGPRRYFRERCDAIFFFGFRILGGKSAPTSPWTPATKIIRLFFSAKKIGTYAPFPP